MQIFTCQMYVNGAARVFTGALSLKTLNRPTTPSLFWHRFSLIFAALAPWRIQRCSSLRCNGINTRETRRYFNQRPRYVAERTRFPCFCLVDETRSSFLFLFPFDFLPSPFLSFFLVFSSSSFSLSFFRVVSSQSFLAHSVSPTKQRNNLHRRDPTCLRVASATVTYSRQNSVNE